jgi:hypothetical protein
VVTASAQRAPHGQVDGTLPEPRRYGEPVPTSADDAPRAHLRVGPPAPPGPQRSRDASRRARALVVVLALFAAAVVVAPRVGRNLFVSGLRQDIAAEQLRTPSRPPELGQWSFVAKQAGRPVAYDPCHAIHYQVRVGVGPLNGLNLVKEGVRRLSEATGLTFVFDGMTDEVPRLSAFQDPDKPVWIGWAGEEETDLWKQQGDVVGLGGSAAVLNRNGRQVYISGYVVMRPDARLPSTFGQGETEGTVLLHELGHLVGLGHVADQNEVMHDGVTHFSGESFGPGDRRGLWEVGASQGCQ